MTKLAESGYAIRRETLCNRHAWHTPAPCHDHGVSDTTVMFRVVSPAINADGEEYDHSVFRAGGGYAIFKSYSGAYNYATA